jgi:hypothetical protein
MPMMTSSGRASSDEMAMVEWWVANGAVFASYRLPNHDFRDKEFSGKLHNCGATPGDSQYCIDSPSRPTCKS